MTLQVCLFFLIFQPENAKSIKVGNYQAYEIVKVGKEYEYES